ncbi:hypothetical protein AC249_AIPGENE26300 [Exaiptasia diaphana]|nr:hypothetical protein AC249_AIPGENE26300 [Exaiptasia diaphana]
MADRTTPELSSRCPNVQTNFVTSHMKTSSGKLPAKFQNQNHPTQPSQTTESKTSSGKLPAKFQNQNHPAQPSQTTESTASSGKPPAKFQNQNHPTQPSLTTESNVTGFQPTSSQSVFPLKEANKELSALNYTANHSSKILKSLHDIWGMDQDFNGLYEDHKMITYDDDSACCWCDKYTTIVYGDGYDNEDFNERFHRQPLPDFPRWLKTDGELHYLPYELRSCLPKGEWDGSPACFLPSHILDMAFCLIPEQSGPVTQSLALLSWSTQEEVETYYKEKKLEMETDMEDSIKRDQWRTHNLFAKSRRKIN